MTERSSKTQDSKNAQPEPAFEPQPPRAGGGGGGFPSGFIRWLLSGSVRQATAMRKHVQKILDHQRDILTPQAIEAVQAAMASCQRTVAETSDKQAIEKQMENLEKAANKWLKPYPNAAWRENVEVLLVALGVAMGIRTFFLQPFKIPTGSMQPTLFGVTSRNLLLEDPDFKIPTGLKRVQEWFEGISYIDFVAKNDGPLTIKQPARFLIFNLWQTLFIGNKSYTLWFPPDYGAGQQGTLEARAGIHNDQMVTNGQQLIKLQIIAGDHLFVDRLSYNFIAPKRGDIVVFETKGIPEENRSRYGIPADQFYIKRLVGLGGERLQLGEDRHLIVNGQQLTAATPHFENVYGFNPKDPPRPDRYLGHVGGSYAPFFMDNPDGVSIPSDQLMVMGDNTISSLDSRYWGYFPATNVIGKSFFVYWPLSGRFGWGNR